MMVLVDDVEDINVAQGAKPVAATRIFAREASRKGDAVGDRGSASAP